MAVATALAATPPVTTPLAPLPVTLVAPARVAADAESRLYITDPLAGKVIVVNALGQQVAGKTNLGRPLGIAVDSQGRIYVGDAQTGAVTVFDGNWNALGQLGQGPGEFQLPGHIATWTEEGVTTVFVSDGAAHMVKAYQNGTLAGQYGSFGLGPNQFSFPAGIWVSSEGNLFVVDQNNDRVQVLDRQGSFLRWFTLHPSPAQSGHSGRAQGITGDAHGRLYVTDTFQGRVKVFAASGTFLGYMGDWGERLGKLRSPGGVVLDGAQRLWLANANNARVDGFCFVHPIVNPAFQSVAEGATATLAVDSGCGGPLSYQWVRNATPLADGDSVSGATNGMLTLRSVTATDAGEYAVWVGNATGTVTSSPSTLTVILRPFITSPPTDQTAPPGGTATLSVTAGGSPPLFYQWFHNGQKMSGQTNRDLTFANVSSAANGIYSVQVTNSAGSASASAKFAAAMPPSLALGNTGGDYELSWNDPFYILQVASDLAGPWQTASVTSPYVLPAITIAQTPAQYFRLHRQ